MKSWGDPNKTPRNFNLDGSLLRAYPNPNDVGACQINVLIGGTTAKKLRLNIEISTADDKSMANYIYSQQGMDGWTWGRACWNRSPES